MKRIIVGGAVAVMLVACGGELVDEPKSSGAEAFCGDGVMTGAEECDDGNDLDTDDCASCRRTSDECGVMGTCDDGRTSYRCSGPAAGVPVRLDGSPLVDATFEGVDLPGGFLYCAAPACVRLAGGDQNCSATGGKWLRCPKGDDGRSAIEVPAGCEFNGWSDESVGYCCE